MGIHGKPDWGLQLKSTVYTFDDLSELAVRLGSISSFDRRGDILFQDSFEHGLNKMAVGGFGTLAEQILTDEKARSGKYSLKLTGGSTGLGYSYGSIIIPYPVLSKIGFEISFCKEIDINFIELDVYLEAKTKYYRAKILYDDVNKRVQYTDENNNWIILEANFNLYSYSNLFNTIKFVCDFDDGKYQRLIINNRTWNLSDKNIFSYTLGVDEYLQFAFSIYSASGENNYAFFDDIIITQNEP